MPVQGYPAIQKPSSRTLPTVNVAMTSSPMLDTLQSYADIIGLGNRGYAAIASTRLASSVAGGTSTLIPSNSVIFSPPYAKRQLHALRYLPGGGGGDEAPLLNPQDAWDPVISTYGAEDNAQDYPITDLSENSTKIKITVPASPEVGENNSFEFEWSKQNVFGPSEINYKTLTTPTISSVELIQPPLHEKVMFTTTSTYGNNIDRTISPDYLRITIQGGYPENPAGTVRFFNLIINGVDLGTYGSETWASSVGAGASNLALRTTDFPYGPLKIQVAVFHLIPDTTFVNMAYAKSDLSPVYEFNCVPNFSKTLYFNYGTYQMPDHPAFEAYYGNIDDFASENQTINTIPEEKDVKVIEVSNQIYKNSTLHPTSKWGVVGAVYGGANSNSHSFTPIHIDAELIIGKFKGTMRINKKKIYGGGDPYFFRGRLLSQIEDVKIELLAPYKHPRQFNKTRTTNANNGTDGEEDKDLYPGVIADIYNLTTSKYYPSPFSYQSIYSDEVQPRMTRPDDGQVGIGGDLNLWYLKRLNTPVPTAIENILKKRYILNKQLIERNIADSFKNDPDLLFNMDQRLNVYSRELVNIDAASCDSLETKEFTFYGNINVSFKMLSSLGRAYETWPNFSVNLPRTAKFKYSLTDLNTNKTIESGEEYTVLLFKPDSFSATPLAEREGI